MTTSSVSRLTTMVATKVNGFANKSAGTDGASSFQGFLQKSVNQEKAPEPKNAKTAVRQDETGAAQNESVPKVKSGVQDSAGKTGQTSAETMQNEVSEKTELHQNSENKKLKEFAEKVQKELGLTNEEMQMWMATLGFEWKDFFDAGKLQQFFMQVKGVDVSELLTNSDMTMQLKALMKEAASLEEVAQAVMAKMPKEADFGTMMEQMLEPEQAGTSAGTLQASSVSERMTETVTVDTASTQKELTQDNLAQEQGQEEVNLTKPALPEAFQKVVATEEQIIVTANGLERVTTTISVRDIYEQVVTKFTAQNVDGTSKVTVQLNPEHLGKLAFQVVSRDGQMTGQFVAESEAVKSALEAQMSQLKLHLSEQGIRVSDVKVVVGDTVNYFAEDKPKEQNQESGKRKSRRVISEITMDAVKEEAETEEIKISTGTVDFTA